MDYFSTIVIEQDANDMFNVDKFLEVVDSGGQNKQEENLVYQLNISDLRRLFTIEVTRSEAKKKEREINTSNSVFILMFFLNRRFKGVSLILSTWFHEAIIIFFLTLNGILCFWPSMCDLIILFYNFSIRIIIDNIITFQKIIIIQF